MIYLDSSVALAHLLAEDRVPPAALWGEELVTSRLLVYEVWTRLHARGLGRSHAASARALFDQLALLDLSPEILARGQEAFDRAMATIGPMTAHSTTPLITLPPSTPMPWKNQIRPMTTRIPPRESATGRLIARA